MPSFAKLHDANKDPLATLDDVWKNREANVVEDLMRESRLRAAEILRVDIPNKMLSLRQHIASTNDESSPFWKGHVHRGDYVRPTMLHHSATSKAPLADSMDTEAQKLAQANIESDKGGNEGGTEGKRSVVLPEHIASIYPVLDGAHSSAAGSEQDNGTINGISKSLEALAERKVTIGGHWFEVVPRNEIQGQCIELALCEFEEMYDLINELKLWLEMEIPVVEDGNSFGTEIQQHLITQLVNANKAIVAWENAVRQHYTDRAKYAAEWVKTPNVEDWALTIASSDRFDHHLIRGYLCRALTTYAGLLTKFERNWEKVLYPKGKQGNSSIGMY